MRNLDYRIKRQESRSGLFEVEISRKKEGHKRRGWAGNVVEVQSVQV
jgi:hypothetical protein